MFNEKIDKKLSTRTLLIVILYQLLLSSCSLFEIKEQSELVENAGEIQGRVEIPDDQKGHVNALLFRVGKEAIVLENQFALSLDGHFTFHVLPATYYVAAFIDTNGDETYQPEEPANYYGSTTGSPTGFPVSIGKTLTLDTLKVKERLKQRSNLDVKVDLELTHKNIGRITDLDNAMFSQEFASMGLWNPIDFIEQIGGGLFFLGEYQNDKIPLLFIHGANGSARDWAEVIARIDRERFQPWVLYYPSGVRLDMVSDYLINAVNRLHTRHGFKKIYIVAHSMGGLVARSFMMKYQSGENDAKLAFAMTINSPMKGMASAKYGTKHSPIVVPSWRDVAEGSDFIQKLHAWQWAKSIPYHLVFSYESGEGDDGVVPLQSQIPLHLQSEAVKIYGFNSGHASILKDAKFIEQFNTILADSLK